MPLPKGNDRVLVLVNFLNREGGVTVDVNDVALWVRLVVTFLDLPTNYYRA